MKRISLTALAVFVLIFMFMSAAQAQSPQETLNQYISDLQKNPNDNALREKIIKLVQTLKPAPVIPEEARRHYVMALTLFKGAKKIEDYRESIEEFKSALLVAPWWAEANRDLGLALEAAQRYDEAISALKLYIATSPGEEKMRSAQDEIYKIEAKKKLIAKEKAELVAKATAEARARAEAEAKAKLESVEGAWGVFIYPGGPPSPDFVMKIYKRPGGDWIVEYPTLRGTYTFDVRGSGRSISFTRMCRGCDPELNTDYYSLSLSPDGTKLVGTCRSISISGNKPHWTTDEVEFFRK
jgi:tetratricopeptide (TPR) repeat protein